MMKGFQKTIKAFNPAFASVKVDKDRLVARAQISFGKPKTTGKAAGDLAQACASVGIAFLVLVAGVCCFIPRRKE